VSPHNFHLHGYVHDYYDHHDHLIHVSDPKNMNTNFRLKSLNIINLHEIHCIINRHGCDHDFNYDHVHQIKHLIEYILIDLDS
jgi:hypothetical protein